MTLHQHLARLRKDAEAARGRHPRPDWQQSYDEIRNKPSMLPMVKAESPGGRFAGLSFTHYVGASTLTAGSRNGSGQETTKGAANE